jgi:CPA2 family monovalent cation:H+ antiporter-2
VSVSALTTLSTPYLIRASDRIADGLVDRAPAPLRSAIDWYTTWVENLRGDEDRSHRARIHGLIRKWLIQIAVDLALITGGMILAWHLAGSELIAPAWLPSWFGGLPTLWWLMAMLGALPVLVHLWYKQRALAMVLAELAWPRNGNLRLDRLRVIVSLAFQSIAIALIAALLVLISITLLPPWPVLVALLAILGLVLALGWHRFVTLYYRAQVSVMENFAGHPEHHAHAAPAAFLEDTVMFPLQLPPGIGTAGKAIRELGVRKLSGASIVAIERDGKRLVNPGPDDVIDHGDTVVLFGTEEQVRQARLLLLG